MVAVVPQPPLMVPQLSSGRAVETEQMRTSARSVVRRMAEVTEHWIVVGGDPAGRRSLDRPPAGTFRGYGIDLRVSLGPWPTDDAQADLPLPLLIAGWLRGLEAPRVTASAELVEPGLPTEQCRQIGVQLAEQTARRAEPVGLLVVGDGAVAHTAQVTGTADPRAEPFDAAVAGALAAADPAGLLALDASLGTELRAAGRAPWQVLAGAVQATGGDWRGELVYSEAPYGIAYHVALWQR
jgi:hypothetical protein